VEVGKLGKRKNSLNGNLSGPNKKTMTVSKKSPLSDGERTTWMELSQLPRLVISNVVQERIFVNPQ